MNQSTCAQSSASLSFSPGLLCAVDDAPFYLFDLLYAVLCLREPMSYHVLLCLEVAYPGDVLLAQVSGGDIIGLDKPEPLTLCLPRHVRERARKRQR